MGFQKPNNLHYQNLMDNDKGEALLHHENHGNLSSTDITSLAKLQHFMEKIIQFHMSKQYDANEFQDNSLAAEMNIQLSLSELDEWRRNTPDGVRNLCTLP